MVRQSTAVVKQSLVRVFSGIDLGLLGDVFDVLGSMLLVQTECVTEGTDGPTVPRSLRGKGINS